MEGNLFINLFIILNKIQKHIFIICSAKPFSFAPQVVKQEKTEDKASNENKDEEDEEPPKQEFKLVTEEGATYEQR